MTTQQHWRTSATIGGLSLGAFDSFSGGEVQGEPTIRRSGASRTLKQYPVLRTYTDVVIMRVLEKEGLDLLRQIHAMVGNTLGTVTRTPIDPVTELPWGKPMVYAGMLSNATPGESDITSTEVTMMGLTLQIADVR